MEQQPMQALASGEAAGPATSRLGRIQHVLLDEWAGVVLCTGAFLAVVIAFALKNTFLNDEGILTFPEARGLVREFWAFLFFHKGKPFNLLLYAIPSEFGFRSFLVAHAFVGAAAVALTCATARTLRIRHPNIAGWMLATSSIFVVASSNGYSNTNGTMLVALFLFLYYTGRRVPSAVVLGLMPFSRYELGIVTLFFLVVVVLRDRDWRFPAAVLAVPVAYLLGGALYNHDLLWASRSFVQPVSMPDNLKVWAERGREECFTAGAIMGFLGRSFLANSPFLSVFALFGFDRRDRRSVVLFAGTVLFYGVLTATQYATSAFATDLRHHTTALPLLALVVAYALAPSDTLARRVAPALSKTADAVKRVTRLAPAARLGLLMAAVCLCGWQLLSPQNAARQQHMRIHEVLSELTRLGLFHGQPVYTDVLPARYDRCAGLTEVNLLVNGSIRWELRASSNPAQLAALQRGFGTEGWMFDPQSLVLRKDALYVIRAEGRNADWIKRLEDLGATGTTVGRYLAYAAPGSAPGAVTFPVGPVGP